MNAVHGPNTFLVPCDACSRITDTITVFLSDSGEPTHRFCRGCFDKFVDEGLKRARDENAAAERAGMN